MRPFQKGLLGAIGLVLLTAACSPGGDDVGSPSAVTGGAPAFASAAPSSAPPAAPEPAPLDHGSISTTYPAFKPDMPTLVDQGGPILSAPVVVTVTWSDNPNAAMYESIADNIGSTKYWKDIVGEYGVGPATSGAANHIRETTPIKLSANRFADPVDDVAKFIVSKLQDPVASGWPAPTPESVYALFIAGSVAQKICDSDEAGGLHDQVEVNGTNVAFALILECDGDPEFSAVESAQISASHELGEASVDPYPESKPGWVGLDANHLSWEFMMMGQDENADLCEFYEDSYGKYSSEQPNDMVQRQWSNASAAAGHSPCVPVPPGASPYFNLVALEPLDPITVNLGPEFPPSISPDSKGLKVEVGATRQIPLGIYSDGPTAPIEISAYQGGGGADALNPQGDSLGPIAKPTVDVSIDKTSGQNGEKTYLSVKVNAATDEGAVLVVVKSKLGMEEHFTPLLVGPGKPPTAPTGTTSEQLGQIPAAIARVAAGTTQYRGLTLHR